LRRRTIAIGILTAIIIVVLAVQIPRTYVAVCAENYNNLGVQEYEKGNYKKAIEYFTKAIELKPDYAEAYFNRGLAYLKTGSIWIPGGVENLRKALSDFNKAIELKPDYVDAYYQRGVTYCEFFHFYRKPFSPEVEDMFNNAIEDFNRALALDPTYYIAIAGKGNAYDRHGDFGKAIEAYEEALKHEDEIRERWGEEGLAAIYYSFGRALHRIDRIDKAEECYVKAMELNPKLTSAVGHLAGLYLDIGKYDKALELANMYYELAAKKDPYHALSIRGKALYYTGNYEDALKDFERLITYIQQPNVPSYVRVAAPEIYRYIALTYKAMGNEEKAEEYFNKSLEVATRLIEKGVSLYKLYFERGLTYAELGEYKKAIEDFKKSAELSPQFQYAHTFYFVEGWEMAGKMYMKLGDKENARKCFEKALNVIRDYEYDLPYLENRIKELLKEVT